MAADVNKIAADCWKRGNDSALKQDYEYAINMYRKAIGLIPDNRLYRDALRGAERKKYGDNGKGARMTGFKLKKIRLRITNARRKEAWDDLDQAAEDGLELNPWDSQLNADLGLACAKRGYGDVAVWAYKIAVKNAPDSHEFNRELALLLEERADYTAATECWQRVAKLNPLDSEARSKIGSLAAKSVMKDGGYEDAENTREVKTGYDYDRPVKSTVPDDATGPGMSLEADLQRALRKDPTDKDSYLKLGDLYRREDRLDEASEVFQKAYEITGDPHIQEQMEDIQLDRMRKNLELAKEQALKTPDDETLKQNRVALATELIKREIQVLSTRVERYPKDSRLKFELAKKWMRVSKWQKAIKLLQGASEDVRIAVEVSVALGDCFVADDQDELAMWQYENATKNADKHDSPAVYLKAHYQLARMKEDRGEVEEAIKLYNAVLSLDYDYKDTLNRVKSIKTKGNQPSDK